jgi:hypothetical protein
MVTRTTAAVPATGMAISRALPSLGLCLVGIAIAVGGCGASGRDPRTVAADAFAWLHPAPAPQGWRSARVASGAALAYPHDWRAVSGDRGTATAGLLDGHGDYLGYLNVTPRQGEETQASWSSFRPRHNTAEGERDVTLQASANGLRFRTGRGACVRDSYTTASGRRYVEIACLVHGARTASVIVGAAPSRDWQAQAPVIERAISALET